MAVSFIIYKDISLILSSVKASLITANYYERLLSNFYFYSFVNRFVKRLE